MKSLSIKYKLLSLVTVSIIIVSFIIMIESNSGLRNITEQIIDKYEKNTYSTKAIELKSKIEIVYKIVDKYYIKSLQEPQKVEIYKKEVLDIIKNIRYDNDGYFWISDSKANIVMHSVRPELDGQNLSNEKDADGVYFYKEFVKVTSDGNNHGLVKYKTLKPKQTGFYPKYSYVIKFQPWDWIIGTGAYVDDIDNSINNIKDATNENVFDTIVLNLVSIILIIFLLGLIGHLIAKRTILTPLENFEKGLLSFFKYLNGEKEEITLLQIKSNDEIGIMSKAINNGFKKVEETIKSRNDENWIKNGINRLSNILINLKELNDVSEKSIDFICNYINAGVGVLYIYNDSNEKLIKHSSYAFIDDNKKPLEFKLKEGLVGEVAFQKKAVLYKNISEQININSSTVKQIAPNLYIYPLIFNNILYGVIEVGSFSDINEKEKMFFDLANNVICQSLLNAIHDKEVKQLLENSNNANKLLEENQLKLEEANAYMEEQQQKLEEANANMEEQQQQLKVSEQNLIVQNNELEASKKDLEKSGKYKSEFLANMSHELRTPLNSVILLSSLLQKNKKENLNKDDVKKIKTIHESGNDLLKLINDILDLSKVESGKMQILIDYFHSKELLNQIKDTFEFTAIEKNIKFNIIDEYDHMISSDRSRISQIIKNLVSNAFKFTTEGSVTLKISSSKERDFRISVIDTGIGIPVEKQELIFKAFTQADGSTNREYGGTGLGLSISRELSKLLGGYIELSSEESKGSIFSVVLPNIEENKILHYEESTNTTNKIIPNIIETFNDDRKIMKDDDEAYLIIDDDKVFTEVVFNEIKNDGNFALVSHTASAGLQLIDTYRIKGILLDLNLPDMDGVDVLKKLKSNQKTKDIPVHVISSNDKDHKILELGAIGYVQKPVYHGDINDIINSINESQKKEIKNLLVIDKIDLNEESLSELVGNRVNISEVQTSAKAISEIKNNSYDTVVVDIDLLNNTNFEIFEFIKHSYSQLVIIITTNRDLEEKEKIKLQEHSNSIIIKSENSKDRILNEINSFLHKEEEEIIVNEEIIETFDLSNLNILIVDDDIKNIFVLDAALKEYNADTLTAFNGLEALDILNKEDNKIDLILMDIMMPIMDGYEAIKEIRKNDKIKHLPIITLTANAMKNDKQKCIDLGADEYITKPIDINILINLINLWSKKEHI